MLRRSTSVAFFVDEGLFRSVHVTFPITAPTAAVTGPVAASANPNTHGVDRTGTNSTGGTRRPSRVSQVDTDGQGPHRITLARLNGKVLKLRLTGPKGNANVAIGYLSKAKKVGTLVKSSRRTRSSS